MFNVVKQLNVCSNLSDRIGFQVHALLDAPFVKCLAVFGGVLKVLVVCACEIVCAAEILLRAHVKVVMVDMVEHGVNACYRWDADWSGRQSCVYISVVRALDVQQVVVDTLQVKAFPCILDCRVGLEAFLQGIRRCGASGGCSTFRPPWASPRRWQSPRPRCWPV